MSDTTFLISGGFFDAVDSDRLYSADQMNQPYKKLIHDGINREADGTTPGFAVTAGGGMNVLVATGNAMIGGKWAENKAVQTIAVAGNTSGSARIDSIILQCDKSRAVRAVQIVYRQGTTAAPDLVSDDDITELRLANIRVPSAASAIASENITDTRGGAECPWVRSVFDAPDARYIVEEYTESELAGAYQTVKSAIDSIRYAAQSGQPTVALQASDMIDSNLVYLYQGSETGYSTGYLYYYSDAAGAWIRGAQYGASVVDTALDEDSENPVQNKAIAVAIKTVRSFVVEVPGSAAAFSGSIAAGDFAKALATYTAGSGVYAVKDGEVYQLSAASSSTMTFTQMYHGTMNFIKQIQITSADTFTVTNTALSSSAADTSYNNTTSGLTATDVQAAIDENAAAVTNVNGRLGDITETVKSVNIFDQQTTTITEGKYLNPNSGSEGTNASYCYVNDYISVKPATTYYGTAWNRNTLALLGAFNGLTVFYTSDKSYISGLPGLSTQNPFTTPENCAYMRISMGTSTYNSAYFMFEEGSTQATQYIPYSEKSKLILPITVVDINGNGDFTSIKDAVSTLPNGSSILVMPGTYEENVKAWLKEIHIIGFDREACILKDVSGNYSTPPLEIGAGSVQNMTIIEQAEGAGSENLGAYAIHVESNNLFNKKLLIRNCYISSDSSSAIGMGLRGGCSVRIEDCEIICAGARESTGAAPIYFHDADAQPYWGVANLYLKNNVFRNTASSLFSMLTINSIHAENTTYLHVMYNIFVRSKTPALSQKFNTWNKSGNSDADGWNGLSHMYLEDDSFGNNLSELNYSA